MVSDYEKRLQNLQKILGGIPTQVKKDTQSEKRIPIKLSIKRDILAKQKQRCGNRKCRKTFGRAIEFHHKNFKKNDNRPSNIIALCPTCHREIHMKKRVREATKTTNKKSKKVSSDFAEQYNKQIQNIFR